MTDEALVVAIESAELAAVGAALQADLDLHTVWLTLAALGRALPTEPEVREGLRMARRDGVDAFVARTAKAGAKRGRELAILRDAVIVDVAHTSTTALATGIQRVARETVRRWHDAHDIVLVNWTEDGTAMRPLVQNELETAISGAPRVPYSLKAADRRIVVPVGGRYVLPELAAEYWRAPRLSAMAQFGGLSTSVIGFDCVPLTSAETVGLGMPGAFAGNLSAVAHMNRVGAISRAAATEYSGWRQMLAPTGVVGPEVRSVLLAAEPIEVTAEAELAFAARAGLDDLPLVLVVGSHEPRKNHLAVLQSAELLWREGLAFRLVFIGGNSWNSADFTDWVARLKTDGYPVTTLSAVTDALLWAAYRRARFTVFPSLNEGFGLPIIESVACGTPVLTSGYGSMKEIGEGNGALLVDSRVDAEVAAGMRALLTDDRLLARLIAEAEAYAPRSWDEYAMELWAYFAETTK